MEAAVASIAYYQLNVVIFIVLCTDLASHVLKTLVPLFSSDIGGSETQISFASFGATQTLGQRSAVYVKLVVKCKLFVLLDVPKGEYADAYLPEDIPLLGNAVGFARVVDKAGQVALVSRVNDFSLTGFHEISACGFAVLLNSCLAEL